MEHRVEVVARCSRFPERLAADRARHDLVDQFLRLACLNYDDNGPTELARTLLRLGADPDITDQRFSETPLGWARHLHQPQLVDCWNRSRPGRGNDRPVGL